MEKNVFLLVIRYKLIFKSVQISMMEDGMAPTLNNVSLSPSYSLLPFINLPSLRPSRSAGRYLCVPRHVLRATI